MWNLTHNLENRLANWANRKFALVTNSGTSALRACLYSLNIKPSSLVAVQAYNYPSVVHAVYSMGFTPVLLDVDSKNFVLLPEELERSLAWNIKAVIITYMWGWLGKINEIVTICKKNNIPLIEDASRAYGARISEGIAGRFGDLAFFSMNDSKALGAGEGGFLVTDDYSLANRAASLGLPLHPLTGCVEKGWELGCGEKHVIHPIGLQNALETLPLLEDRIIASQRKFKKAIKELNGIEIVKDKGLRGAWKDIAFSGTSLNLPKQYKQFIRKEFETNNITTWAPKKWFGSYNEFNGAKAGQSLSVIENICNYNPNDS